MSIYVIYFIFILLIICYIILDYQVEHSKKKIELDTLKKNYIYIQQHFNNPYKENTVDMKKDALKKCQVPTLNTEQCYKSTEYECPIVNGSYLQCTNNYIPKPSTFNAPCNNRTFEMTPQNEKISENCYYNNIGWNRDKFVLNLK